MTDPDEEWERALAAWERLEREVDAQAKQEAPTLAAEAGGGDDSLERQLEAELDALRQEWEAHRAPLLTALLEATDVPQVRVRVRVRFRVRVRITVTLA